MGTMAPCVSDDPLPYELHTNRELEFMLERGKLLAHFSDAYPSDPDEEIFPELAFAAYVQAGKFVKRRCCGDRRQRIARRSLVSGMCSMRAQTRPGASTLHHDAGCCGKSRLERGFREAGGQLAWVRRVANGYAPGTASSKSAC